MDDELISNVCIVIFELHAALQFATENNKRLNYLINYHLSFSINSNNPSTVLL